MAHRDDGSPVKRVLIYGAGDLGRSQKFMFEASGVRVEGFADDLRSRSDPFEGLPIFGDADEAIARQKADADLGLSFAIGYKRFDLRVDRFEYLESKGARIEQCLHPSVVVDDAATIGDGCVLFAGTVVDHGCVLEENVLLNTGVVVAHDTRIKRHSFVAPGVVFAGFVTVGPRAFIGTGARVAPHVQVGEGAIVGAGAVVLEDIEPYTLVAGVPAKPKKTLPREGLVFE